MRKIFLLVLVLGSCGKKEKPESVVNDLPALVITKTDGSQLAMKSVTGKTVIVMFQPDCDHCQREAIEIRNHVAAFADYQVYFVSSAPVPTVDQFSIDYKFKGLPNFHFGVTTVDEVLNSFGPIDAPSVYIYNEQGRLKQNFNGETVIQLILRSL